MWVYIQSEPSLWTVGFYDPAGAWQPDSDHDKREEAARRCAWLNGSPTPPTTYPVKRSDGRTVNVTIPTDDD